MKWEYTFLSSKTLREAQEYFNKKLGPQGWEPFYVSGDWNEGFVYHLRRQVK